MSHDSSPRLRTRRDILGGIGMSLLVAPLSQVIACGSGHHNGGKQGGNGAAARWATGGTAAMIAASTYPDPFAAGPGTACKMTCKQVLERRSVRFHHDHAAIAVRPRRSITSRFRKAA